MNYVSQWVLLRRIYPTDQVIALRDPDGHDRFIALALVDPGIAAEVRLLAGGPLPKRLLDALLIVTDPDRPWTFYYRADDALYVYLCPPRSTAPVKFSLAGMRPEILRELRLLIRGSQVPDAVMAALASVPGEAPPVSPPSDPSVPLP